MDTISPAPVSLPTPFSPIHSFIVNTVDYSIINSAPQPDSNLNNIIYQIQNAAVSIERVPGLLKHGDVFTLSGEDAYYVYNLYIGRSPQVLEVFVLPDIEDLAISWADTGLLQIDWNPSSTYYTTIDVSIDGADYITRNFDLGVGQVTWDVGNYPIQVRARFATYGGDHSPDFSTASLDLAPIVTTDDVDFHFDTTAIFYGSVVSDGLTSLTAYGFVWATHDSPTIDDNVITVGAGDFLGTYNYHTSPDVLPLFDTIYIAAFATNSNGTSYGSVLSGTVLICLIEGTKITLADGTNKNIENISYDDWLLTWNFDKAVQTQGRPVWIVQPFKTNRYSVVRFSDGSQLGTIADGLGHRIFNVEKGKFTHMMSDVDTPIGTTTVNQSGKIVSVIGKGVVEGEVTFYNIIVHKHMNVYANTLLTSTGLNNVYPIVNMQFVKDDRKPRSKDEFGNISEDIFEGLRLAEQPANYPALQQKVRRLVGRQEPVR